MTYRLKVRDDIQIIFTDIDEKPYLIVEYGEEDIFAEQYYQMDKTEILNNLNSFTHCSLSLSFLCDRLKMTLKNTNNSMNDEYVMSHINLIDKQLREDIDEFIKNESKPYVLK